MTFITAVPATEHDDPRDADNLGTIVTWHRRYRLGDKQPKVYPGEWMLLIIDEYDYKFRDRDPDDARIEAKFASLPLVCLPVFMYDHSNIVLSTGPFGCPWDSGRLGLIYCTRDKFRDFMGSVHKWRVRAREILKAELEEYSAFVSGDYYTFTVYRDKAQHDADPDDYEDIFTSSSDFARKQYPGAEIVDAHNVDL